MPRHYHIRWSGRAELDWECFATSADAQESAEQLVQSDETYTVEEHNESCPRCGDLNSQVVKEPPCPDLKYPWQQTVYEAFLETHPQRLPGKINAAEQAIATRLCDPAPSDSDEQRALREALTNLRMIFPERVRLDLARAAKTA